VHFGGAMFFTDYSMSAMRRRLKTAAIARSVRAQFLKRSDLTRPGRVSRPPTREKRRSAATQTYMAIAPPST
jgi:hypothetical protein